MCKSWKMKSGCGGHIESTPPIGKVVPLGLVCDEKVLQDGWQGQMDTSKCRNVAGFRMHVHVVGRIIILPMNRLWEPTPGPRSTILSMLNLVFIPLHKTWQ